MPINLNSTIKIVNDAQIRLSSKTFLFFKSYFGVEIDKTFEVTNTCQVQI